MILLWLVTGAALVAAFVAWRQARRTPRRLDQLSQLYWELKYATGEQQAQLQRLTGDTPAASSTSAARTPKDGFIPLTSLRR